METRVEKLATKAQFKKVSDEVNDLRTRPSYAAERLSEVRANLQRMEIDPDADYLRAVNIYNELVEDAGKIVVTEGAVQELVTVMKKVTREDLSGSVFAPNRRMITELVIKPVSNDTVYMKTLGIIGSLAAREVFIKLGDRFDDEDPSKSSVQRRFNSAAQKVVTDYLAEIDFADKIQFVAAKFEVPLVESNRARPAPRGPN